MREVHPVTLKNIKGYRLDFPAYTQRLHSVGRTTLNRVSGRTLGIARRPYVQS